MGLSSDRSTSIRARTATLSRAEPNASAAAWRTAATGSRRASVSALVADSRPTLCCGAGAAGRTGSLTGSGTRYSSGRTPVVSSMGAGMVAVGAPCTEATPSVSPAVSTTVPRAQRRLAVAPPDSRIASIRPSNSVRRASGISGAGCQAGRACLTMSSRCAA